MFDYVLRPENRSWRAALIGGLRPIIVLGALLAFMVTLALNRPKPVKRGPTEVRFAIPLPASAPGVAGDFKLPRPATPPHDSSAAPPQATPPPAASNSAH